MANLVPEVVLPNDDADNSSAAPIAEQRPSTPNGRVGPVDAAKPETKAPVTPTRPTEVKKAAGSTPRLKKKVPWRGKNITVSLPRDEERGQRGKAPIPLKQHEVANMFREWEELGYDIRGFDLNVPQGYCALPVEHHSRSRDEWPDVEHIKRERADRKYKVTLPDLEGERIGVSPSPRMLN
jgi:hypothetical protein